MRTPISLAAALCLVVSAAAIAAPPIGLTPIAPLLAAGSNDQVPTVLVRLPAPSQPIERATVHFAWPLDPAAALQSPAPYLADSREFWRTTDGAALQAGLPLRLSSAGALIQLSPARGANAIDPTALTVVTANGANVAAERLDAPTLQAQGMPVTDGSVMLRLTDASRGDVRLRLPSARGQYVVHVYEPASPWHLQASLQRDHALAGTRLRVEAAMLRDGTRLADTRAGGLLVSPSGNSWPLTVVRGRDGRLQTEIALPTAPDTTPGLWEVQLFAESGGIARDARTAFALAQPTARLAGGYRFDARTVQLQLPVVAGSPGRYEARGVLYATGPDLTLHPVAAAQVAAWLEPGTGVLQLRFGRHNLPLGYGAPFEVRDLQLNDQSRMAPLEQRERALRASR